VASHPNTPAVILERFAQTETEKEIIVRAMQNPNTTFIVLETMARILLRQHQVSFQDKQKEYKKKKEHENEAINLIQHPLTSLKVLEILSHMYTCEVIDAIISSPQASSDFLRKLLECSDQSLTVHQLRLLAKNPNASPEILGIIYSQVSQSELDLDDKS
jgi:hypothetical protein